MASTQSNQTRTVRIARYITNEKYKEIKYSVITRRPNDTKVISKVDCRNLHKKILHSAYKFRVLENPGAIHAVRREIREYIKRKAPSYIDRIIV